MNYIIKQLLIIICCFILMIMLQNYEDNKINKKYETIYDEYKYPVLISSLVGLCLNLDLSGNSICFTNYEEDTITITDHIDIDPANNTIKTLKTGELNGSSTPGDLNGPRTPVNELNIHTQLPNF